MTDLSKIGKRDELKPRGGDEPHWQRLKAGCYLGYRPSKRGGRGTWFARAYNAETAKYQRRPLGDFGELKGNDVFAQAKRDAEAWAEKVETGGVRAEKLETVADACRAYLKVKPGSIAEGVFRRHVYDDPIAKVRIDKLRRHHLQSWRERLEDAPAFISRNKIGEKVTKKRSKSTVNRDMVPLRAALGAVLALGAVSAPGAPGTDAAWQEALKPYPGADGRRVLYIDLDERRRLLKNADALAAPFIKALCLLPLRPGAVASLCALHFDKRTRSLTIGKDKNGLPRQIAVPESIANFLAEQVKGKLPGASIFTRAGGAAWNKDAWKQPVKAAAIAAKLPSGLSAYTLRHSVITDLVRDGLPILTVAQISGTSVAMIEKHYGHLARDAAENSLAKLVI